MSSLVVTSLDSSASRNGEGPVLTGHGDVTLGQRSHGYMESENLNFVLKIENAPILPQCRPIKTFWAICNPNTQNILKTPKTLQISSGFGKKLGRKLQKTLAQHFWRPCDTSLAP